MNYKVVFSVLAIGVFSIIFSSLSAYAQPVTTSAMKTNEAVVNEQSQITLSGSGSFDPDNEPILYYWEQVDGDPVTLSSTSDPDVTFTTPAVLPHQTKDLRFALTVVDPHGASDISSYTLHVIHVNHPPVVTTTHEFTVTENVPVTLTATAVDPDNDSMTYSWTQDSGDKVTLGSTNTLTTTFTSPLLGSVDSKDLKFTITADDGNGGTGSDSVVVHVIGTSTYSLATLTCGPIIRGHEGGTLKISEIIDNPANLPLTYQWAQISGMPVQLSSTTDAAPSIQLPRGSGGNVYDFQLTVKQGDTVIGTCEQYVYAAPPEPGAPPVADAGPDQVVQGGTTVALDGTKSTGGYLKFSWTQIRGEPVTLLNPNSPTPEFTAPDVAIGEEKHLTFTLTVSNGFGKDAADVNITVVHSNQAPHSIITLQQ